MTAAVDTDQWFLLEAAGWPLVPVVPVGVVGVVTRELPVDVGPARYLGVALFVAGVAWYLWAVVTLLAGGSSPVGAPPERLVTAGPFGYSRNPMFLGVVVALLGEGLVLSSAPAVVAAVAAWWLFDRLVVAWEERRNHESLGEAYEAYCRDVPRWFGPF